MKHHPGPHHAVTAPTLAHSNPFARSTFIPPSGAPSFAGDRAWDKGFSESFETADEAPVELLGRSPATTTVLEHKLARELRAALPALHRLAKSWTLLYSLDQHGISLSTLYTRCATAPEGGGTILALRDADGALFGTWIGEPLRMHAGSYYGSGEAFLWKEDTEDASPRVWKWTGANSYVALCEPKFISFGGGEGHYGLYIDAGLLDGSSARCSTFGNAILCSGAGDMRGEARFECVGLEVWSVPGLDS